MTLQYDENGLSVQTFDESLAEVHAEAETRISVGVAKSLKSWFGQVWYMIAKFEHGLQEKLQQVYQNFDPRSAEGAHLDRALVGWAGVKREAAARAEVLGTVTASATTTILDGSRLEVGGYTFEIVDGPYTRVGAGTIENVRVRSQLYQAIDVSTLGAWTLTDAVTGFDSFDDDSQPVAGRTVELDAEYTARADEERFSRAARHLDAIDAGVGLAAGVSYAKSYENVDPATNPDANGIDLWSVNVVVDGGTDQVVAEAIEQYGPAGQVYQGAVEVTLGSGGTARVVGFDRVTDVDMWIRVTITTSTSEDVADALDHTTPGSGTELEAAVDAALLPYTAATWVIGKDAIPDKLAGAVTAESAGIPAIDEILVELSTDDGVGDAYSGAKRETSIRERAIYATARLTVVEV